MACTSTSSPDDVAAPFGLDSSHLNKPCTKAFFLPFSDHVHPWRLVFAELICQTDLDDVDSEQTGRSEKEKRLACLGKWKTRRGDGATFRAVLEAVLSTGNVGSAEALCRIIAGRKHELSQDQSLTTCSVLQYQPSESSVAMTRSNEEKIKALFAALVLRVGDAVKASSDVERIRHFLVTFFECDFPDTTEVRKLFEAISLRNLWNYQHHSPLESVANHFLSGNQQIERLIKEYKAHLSGFYLGTKLVDFIEAKKLTMDDVDNECDDQQPPVLSPKQYRRLKVALKLERKISELSLEYVHKLWCSFAEEYDIPSLTVVLEKVASGSLVITWLIPTHLADKIVPKSNFFRDHGIVCVSLDGQPIYDEDEMCSPWQLYVSGMKETTHLIRIKSSEPEKTTVARLKELVRHETGIDPEGQKLIHAGKQIEDGKRLCDYPLLGNNSTLMLVVRLHGGGGRTSTSSESSDKGDVDAHRENQQSDLHKK